MTRFSQREQLVPYSFNGKISFSDTIRENLRIVSPFVGRSHSCRPAGLTRKKSIYSLDFTRNVYPAYSQGKGVDCVKKQTLLRKCCKMDYINFFTESLLRLPKISNLDLCILP